MKPTPKTPYNAIIFDFDGVLVESVDVKTQAFVALYAPYGELAVKKVIDHHLINGGVSRKEKFAYCHREFLGKSLTGAEVENLSERFSLLVEEAVVHAESVAGANAFLSKYATILPLFIASGTPEDELQRIVKKRKMSGYFQGVFGSPRKKGELLKFILRQFDFKPEKVLMIGDSITDYIGAVEAGVSFLGRSKNLPHPFPAGTRVIPDLSSLEDEITEKGVTS